MEHETEAVIIGIIPRTYNVKSFRLKPKNETGYAAGQYLLVSINAGEKELTKPLTISSSPTEKGYVEFTKKITDSEFSNALNMLKFGGVVKIKYPFGNFTLDDKSKKIAFLSGGIGITPIRSICRYAVDRKLDTDIILVYGNKSAGDIVFKEDFEAMQERYYNLKVVHVLSEPDIGIKSYTGLINSRIIKDEVPDYLERKFYLCGPPAMIDTMKNIIFEELKVTKQNVVTEKFMGY